MAPKNHLTTNSNMDPNNSNNGYYQKSSRNNSDNLSGSEHKSRSSRSSRRPKSDPVAFAPPPYEGRSPSGSHPYDARKAVAKARDDSAVGAIAGGGGSSGSRSSRVALAQKERRRRVTNYTETYTPPAELVEHAARARSATGGGTQSTNNTDNSLLRESNKPKPTKLRSSKNRRASLDRSEEDGDERQGRLRGTGGELPQPKEHSFHGSSNSGNGQGSQPPISDYEAQQLEQLRRQHYENKARLQAQQQQQQQAQARPKIERGSSSARRSSQEKYASASTPRGSSSSTPRESSSRKESRRSTQERSNQSRQPRKSSASTKSATSSDSERAEQQRIEEYAGKRALLRLEQELADHSESNNTNEDSIKIKSVMDRRKLARVPQVKKSDLIIGEYLGRGNFCDVFEVTWILPEQARFGLSAASLGTHMGGGGETMMVGGVSNRTLSTYDDSEHSGEDADFAQSMESLELSCSNDLSLIRNEGDGSLSRSASRRSVSQVRTSGAGMADFMRGGGGGNNNNLRNPNTMALKCLRPAVRAQPRKFVIGAEDLAHETALLACLDHPNIIQLYGRAEGCFSTAFQMRDKNSSNNNPRKSDGSSGGGSKGGKQMSNEGYFIILDRLMTTMTDRNDEWKDECRAINGVAPPDGTPIKMPPETTLREHLCKRLKVAYCIADALEYLHSRHCVFRDLKPANVGFDCNDCVKMFDFGFATSIAPLLSQPYEGYGPLTETCGTRRYMAPEVALKLGYGKEVDVYSFGMLLWEICALDKPFDSIQSVEEFHDLVVLCGRRPSLNIDPLWPSSLKGLMSKCWSTDPLDRPTMVQVKSLLCNVLRDMNKAMENSSGREGRGGGSGGSGGRGGGTQQQRQEQGGNFVHKWRRRISI